MKNYKLSGLTRFLTRFQIVGTDTFLKHLVRLYGLPTIRRSRASVVRRSPRCGQRDHFRPRQMSKGPLGQRAELQGPDRHADETKHADTQRFEETANVTVPALVENDFQPRILLAVAQHGGAFCREEFAGGGNAAFETPGERFVRHAIHPDRKSVV